MTSSKYVNFNVVLNMPTGFASASVLLPDQTDVEFVEKCQYSRAVSELDSSKRDGVLAIEFGFHAGYFEVEPIKGIKVVVKPI